MARICVVILLLSFLASIPPATAGCQTTQTDDLYGTASSTTCTGTENSLPDVHSGQADFPDGGKVKYKGKTYQLEPGGSINADGGAVTISKGKEITTDAGTQMSGVTRARISPAKEEVESAQRISRDDLDLKKTNDVTLLPGGDFKAKKAAVVSVGGITAHAAAGISREGNTLSINKAERIEVSDGLLAGVEEFTGNKIQFRIEQARDVVIDCVSLRGVEHSEITIQEDGISIRPFDADVDFTISDCEFSQSAFQAISDQAQIFIPRKSSQDYEIKNAELTCHGPNTNERLEAKHTSSIRYGAECFTCLLLSKDSTYWYADKDLIRDFGITPHGDEQYPLCIRKEVHEQYPNSAALVDFIDHRMSLPGKVSYRRLPVRDGQILSLISEPVYQSTDASNQAKFELDVRFDQVKNLRLTNSAPGEGVLSLISNGHYAVYEHGGNGSVNRYGRFTDKFMPAVIESYESDLGSETPVVRFRGDLMIQEGGNDYGTQTRVTAVCDQCSAKATFINDMKQQSQRLEMSAGRCGS